MVDEGRVTIFVTHGPDEAHRSATPFYMSSVALAMDCECEMIFQINGVLMVKKGIAETTRAKEGGKLIIDFLKEAKEYGVRLSVCSAALALHDMSPDDLIDEVDEVVGAAHMIESGLESDLVLTY